MATRTPDGVLRFFRLYQSKSMPEKNDKFDLDEPPPFLIGTETLE